MKKLLLLSILAFAFYNSFSQYFGSEQFYIDHIKLASDSAGYIFEGTVLEKHSYWNPEHNFIYTSNTVKVKKVFKGTIKSSVVEMITRGGMVNDTLLDISHNLGFGIGETGMFFAIVTDRPQNPSTQQPAVLVLRDYDGAFVKYYKSGADTTATYLLRP